MRAIITSLLYALRYALVAIIAVGSITAIIAYATNLYPVALVDGSPIWMRTWKEMIQASENYTNADLKAQGELPINFSLPEHSSERTKIERDALTFLIEDSIITNEGNGYIDGFGSVTGEEVARVLRESPQDPKAIANDIYHMTLDEYRATIVAPQVRRSTLRRLLEARGRKLDEWLTEMKIKKSIKLYFTRYHWNGERVD